MTLSLQRRVGKLETGGADSALAADFLRALEAGRQRALTDPAGTMRRLVEQAEAVRVRRDAGERLTNLDHALLRILEMPK